MEMKEEEKKKKKMYFWYRIGMTCKEGEMILSDLEWDLGMKLH